MNVQELRTFVDQFLALYSIEKAKRAIIGDESGAGGFIGRLKNVIKLNGKSLNCTNTRTRRLNESDFDSEYTQKYIDYWDNESNDANESDSDSDSDSGPEAHARHFEYYRKKAVKRPARASEIEAKRRKMPRITRCTKCGDDGHNSRTCSKTSSLRESNPPLIRARPIAVRAPATSSSDDS